MGGYFYQWQKIQNGFVYYETNVRVFDPFLRQSQPPLELKERAYQQTIYWKRDDLLAIETRDLQKRLLHFYYEVDGTVTAINLSQQRQFLTEDILPYYLRLKRNTRCTFVWS